MTDIMTKQKPNFDKEYKKIISTLSDIIKNEEYPALERWHMIVMHDVLISNDLTESNKEIIFSVIALFDKLQRKGLTHNSMRELRRYIRSLNLKLEF